MTTQERDAILAIAMMAAFADGNNDERERAELKSLAESLSEGGANVSRIYQDVLLKRVNVASLADQLTTPESRQLAFEMAVGVCDADGAHSDAETTFLNGLRDALGLSEASSTAVMSSAAAMADAPLESSASSEPQEHVPLASTMTEEEQDKMILNYAILNGALELLPQSMASMAIIPLQMKMVYAIGKSYGFTLDKGHIKDFLGTLGVGLTSQYVEQFGRRLLGGLLGKVAGGIGRTVGSVAAGSTFSFATTYALGMVAKRYYADGRRLSADSLKLTFTSVLAEAKSLQREYTPEIEHKASTLDVTQVLKEVAKT